MNNVDVAFKVLKLFKDNNIEDEIVSEMESVLSAPIKAGAAPEQPAPKKKGGLAPLIDLINAKYDKVKFPRLNQQLIVYLKSHLGKRRLPSIEKWEDMLNRLNDYASIELVGTSGTKFLENNALLIVEKAINIKGEAPYPDFDNIFHSNIGVIESDFSIKGY